MGEQKVLDEHTNVFVVYVSVERQESIMVKDMSS